jgi:hypothetical protein
MRISPTLVLRTIGLAALLNAHVAFGAEDGFHFGLELRPADIQSFPNYLQQIGNVPVSLRTVPIHSGDPGAGNPAVIPVNAVQPGSYVPFSVSAAPEIGYRRLTFRGGVIFSPAALRPQPEEASSGSTQEYNYIQGGNSRGYGAALVYYAGLVRPALTPGVFGEAEIRLGGGFSVILGYRRSTANVEIQQGWDRYDALETHQTLRLSTDTLQQPCAGLRWSGRSDQVFKPSVYLIGGPTLVATHLTATETGVTIQYASSPYFIGAGVGLAWDWHGGGKR